MCSCFFRNAPLPLREIVQKYNESERFSYSRVSPGFVNPQGFGMELQGVCAVVIEILMWNNSIH